MAAPSSEEHRQAYTQTHSHCGCLVFPHPHLVLTQLAGHSWEEAQTAAALSGDSLLTRRHSLGKDALSPLIRLCLRWAGSSLVRGHKSGRWVHSIAVLLGESFPTQGTGYNLFHALPYLSENNDLNPGRRKDSPPLCCLLLTSMFTTGISGAPYTWKNTSSCKIMSHLYLIEHSYYSTGRLRPRGLSDFLKAKVNSRTECRLQVSQLPVIKIIASIIERCNHGSGIMPDTLGALPHIFIAWSLWGRYINPILQMRDTVLWS